MIKIKTHKYEERQCKMCNKKFSVLEYSNKKFCSEHCRELFYKKEPSCDISVICIGCKKEFVKKNNSGQKYCSKECRENYYKNISELHKQSLSKMICKNCGKEFQQLTSNQKYCSKECRFDYYKSMKLPVIGMPAQCEYCNNQYIKNNGSQKYCSDKCRNLSNEQKIKIKKISQVKKEEKDLELIKNEVALKAENLIKKSQVNGKSFNNVNINYWLLSNIPQKTIDNVLDRDNNQCYMCKRTNNLHIHHIIKRVDGGDHSMDNLVTLCASCHRYIEIGDIEYAKDKCFENAKYYYFYKDDFHKNSIDINEIAYELQYIFNDLLNDNTYESLLKISKLLDDINK